MCFLEWEVTEVGKLNKNRTGFSFSLKCQKLFLTLVLTLKKLDSSGTMKVSIPIAQLCCNYHPGIQTLPDFANVRNVFMALQKCNLEDIYCGGILIYDDILKITLWYFVNMPIISYQIVCRTPCPPCMWLACEY